MFGKQTCAPFKGTECFPLEFGNIIVLDLCGPFETSIRSYRYFVTWKDLKTHYASIKFIKNKECATVTNSFRCYITRISRQKSTEVKKVQTDNGGEYTRKEFLLLCNELGIIHETTTPSTLEHNSVVEHYKKEHHKKVLSPYNMI